MSLPASGLPATLADAELGQLHADRFTFVHGLARESLERTATEAGRALTIHRGIADELARIDARPERVAQHYIDAEASAEALVHAHRAVRERLRTGDFPSVHAWTRRIHELLDGQGADDVDVEILVRERRRRHDIIREP